MTAASSLATWLPLMVSAALTALLLAAAGFDVARFRIPNPIPLAVAGLCLVKVVFGIETAALLPQFLVFACTLCLGFLAFTAGLLGGGDVKLIAALALWFDPSTFADFLTITGIVGGLLGVVLLVARRTALAAPTPASAHAGATSLKNRLLAPQAPLPYALPIASAALWLEWVV